MAEFDRDLQRVRRGVASRIVRGCSRRGLLSSTALQAVAVVAVLALTQRPARAQLSANAHPTGGQVVAGQAAIAQTADTTTVTQTSARAAVNWQSYNVGSAQTVRYVDPSSHSVTLNRVVGPNPSQIAGRIVSNGTVMIVNQAGLLFDGSAQINTAGLVVSAAGITNKHFMAGKMVFDQAANPGAKIENRGTITIKNQGLAALVAPQVVNSGVIRAKLGKVILAGAEAETLDLYGDGMVSINVTKQVATAPDGRQALVTNTGAISASGGTVLLTAQAVDGVVQTLVDAGGKISANSVGGRTGRVVIAGAGGDVEVTGAVTANGHAPGTTGGSVVVNTTGAVRLASTARVSASGRAGGGVVAIGTTLRRAKGGPSVTARKTAKTVTVAAGATIAANATANGNGGRVTVLSTDRTTMAGAVDTKGGPQGGDGGFVELSGGVLSLTGLVDASAPMGKTGNLLLDPSDLYVSDAMPLSATPVLSLGSSVVVNGGTVSWVSPTELAALAANITLSAANNLFFASGSAGANTLSLGGNSLTASAGNDLTIDRGFTISAGAISLTASAGAITLGGTSGVDAGLIDATQLAALDATSLQGPSGSNVTMLAGSGIQLADAAIGSSAAPLGTLSLSTSGGGVTQAADGVISAGTLMSGGTLVGSVDLAGTANAIANIGSVAVTSGGFSLTDGVSLNVGILTAGTSATIVDTGTLLVSGMIAPSGAGPIDVSLTSGNLNLAGVVSDGGTGTTTLIANQGSIVQSGGSVLAGALTGRAVTSASLTQPTNLVGTLGAFSTGAGFALTDNEALSVTGPVIDTGASSTLALTTGTGDLTLAGTVSATNVLDLVSAGSIVQSGGSISAAFLTGSAVTSASLTQPTNLVGTLGAFSTGAGFALTDNEALSVNGPVTDTGASSTLALTTGTGDLTLAGTVSATNVLDLASAGSIVQSGGSISAAFLTGRAVTSASLMQPTNLVGTLGPFSTGAGFALTDNEALLVNGPVTDTGASSTLALTTRTGDLTIAGTVSATNVLDLVSAGSIVQSGGSIGAAFLTGRAVTSASLTQPTNLVGTLGAFSTGAGFALTDNEALSVTGPVTDTGASSTLALTTGTGDLTIAGNVTATNVLDLASAGSIVQSGGSIGAAFLTGSAVTSASLTQPTNLVGTLGAFSTGAGFALTDNEALSVNGPVTDTGASSTLALTTRTGDLTLAGTVSATNVLDLVSAGSIVQSDGLIGAAFLTGSAVTSASLTQPTNLVGTLGAFSTGAGFALTDNEALSVNGPVTDTGASSTLALTTGTGDLTLAGTVSATNVLDLASAGSIVQSGGSISAAFLTGRAVTSASLMQPTNLVGTLGPFSTGAGFALTDNEALLVNGPVTDTGASSTLALTTRTGDLTIAGTVSATNVLDLVSAGSIVQSGGSIGAAFLTGRAVTSASLTQPTNLVGTLGAFSTGAGFALTDNEALSVTGPVTDTGASSTLALTTGTGDLTIAGNVTATNVLDLASAGSIVQSGGSIGAAFLTGSAVTSASLTQSTNLVGTLGAFSTGAGFALTDNEALSVNGPVTDTGASSTLALTTGTGDLTIAGNVTATNVLDLVSAGSIVQSGGSIGAAFLTGRAVTSASLTQPTNLVGTLGAFSTGAGFALTDNEALSVTGPVIDTGASSTLALTTGTGDLTLAGTVSATNVLDLVSAGSIVQSGGSISAAFLTGSAVTSASLTQPTNLVGTLGAFSTGAGFALTDNEALSVNGPVTDTGASSTLALTTGTGDLTIAGNVTATNVLDLASAGSIVQSGGSIGAAFLTGRAVTSASLTQPTNLVGTLGAFSSTAGFSLTDNEALKVTGAVGDTGAASTLDLTTKTGGLTLAGNVSAGNVLDLVSAGSISQSDGSVRAGTLILTTTGAGNVDLTNASNQIGVSTGISVNGGGLVLVDDRNLVLTGTHSANQLFFEIDAPGGALQLGDNTTGAVLTATSGPISLVADTMTEGTAASAITAPGAVVQLAPFTAGRDVSLAGTVSGNLLIDNTLLGDITAGSLFVGQYFDQPNGGATRVSADNISIDGAVNPTGVSIGLGLFGSGAITEPTGSVTILSLVGSGRSITLLAPGNHIAAIGGSLGNLTATGGNLSIANGTSLNVFGTVSASGNVYLQTPSATGVDFGVGSTVIAGGLASFLTDSFNQTGFGSVFATTFELAPSTLGANETLGGTGSTLASLNGINAGLVRVGAVTGPGSGLTTTAGSISVTGSFGDGSTNLELDSLGGIGQASGAVLTAGTLAGNAGADVVLPEANAIGGLGSFMVNGALTLSDSGRTGALVVSGPVTATNVTITGAPAIDVTGSIDAALLTLLSGAGGIHLDPGDYLSAGTVDISTLGGGLTQISSGTILAGLLTSSGSIAGPAILQGTANQIGTISGLTAGGTLTVVDSEALALVGMVSAGAGGTVDITTSSGGLTQGPSGILVAGTLTSSGGIFGPAILQGSANQIGTIGGLRAGGTLTVVDSEALALTGVVSAGNAGTMDITTLSGGLLQGPSGILVAGTLSSSGGISGPAILQGTANQIGTISGLTVGGTLTVVDSEALALAGVVSAGGGGTVDITTLSGGLTQGPLGMLVAGTLTSSGGIFGPAILQGTGNQIGTISGLAAGGALTVVDSTALTLSGLVSAGHAGTVDITTLSGGVGQGASGSLIAGVLTSSGGVSGGVVLQGTGNRIGSIEGLTSVGTLTVVDGEGLSLAGLVSAGTAGSVDITTLAGGLTQAPSGTLIAGTLASSGGIFGPAILQGTENQIGTISGLTAGGALTVVDSGSLALAGVVSAGNTGSVDITTLSGGLTQGPSSALIAGTLTSTGGIAGPAILQGTSNQIGVIRGLTAGGTLTVVDGEGLTLAGLVSVGNAGSVDVTTLSGGLTQGVSGTLVAGILSSSGGIFGPAILQGTANRIGTISGLTAGGALTVVDSEALVLAGVVSAGNTGSVDITTLSGGVTQGPSSALITGTLTSTGGITGPAILQGTANQIGTISGLTAGGALTVADSEGLTLAGVVNAGTTGLIDISISSGGLTQAPSGALIGGTLTSSRGIFGPAILQETGNQIGTISDLTSGGALTVVDSKALTLAGLVSAGNSGSVDITTLSGGLTQGPSGTLIADTLTSSGGISGPAILQGTANRIGTITGLTASGMLTVVDDEALDLAGFVSAGTGGIVDITVASGGLSQGAAGTLVAGTLLSSGGVAGSVSLLGLNNQIANLGSAAGVPGSLRATGDIVLNDAVDLLIPGDVVAGSGTAAPPNASLSITLPADRTLTINGEAVAASAAGGVTVNAGTIVIAQAGPVQPLVEANGPVTLSSGDTLSQSAGAIAGGSVTLGAPGNAVFSNGTIVATSGTIGVTAPLSTVGSGEIIAALGTGSGIFFSGSLVQGTPSYIGSNGSVAIGSLTENGGTLLAVGNIGLGGLSQSGGTIASGAGLSIGQGIGVAGWSGSSATAGAFNQSGGLLAATSAANVFTIGGFTQTGGIVATGGTLGVTANNGIVIDGIVSAAGPSSGFMLLANSGDAILGTTGLLAGPVSRPSGGSVAGNALQAPAGMVQIAGPSGTQGFAGAGTVGGITPATGYELAPPAAPPGVPMLSAPVVGAPVSVPVPVQLVGNSIDLERSMVASTLVLSSATTITEGQAGLINAGTLTGSAGGDVTLANNNVIGTLGSLDDTGHAFWLVDASNLMLSGILSANSVRIEDVGFEIDLTSGNGFAGVGAGSTNPRDANAFPAPGSPGIYLLASNFRVAENPILSTDSVIDWTFALPETGTGVVGLGDFQQPKVNLFLSLGAGTATGQVDIAGLQITYAKASAMTVRLTGVVGGIAGQTAASSGHISPSPSNNYQINGCPISSVNCIKFTGLTVPVTNPLQDVEFGDMLPLADIDIILPDVAERDY